MLQMLNVNETYFSDITFIGNLTKYHPFPKIKIPKNSLAIFRHYFSKENCIVKQRNATIIQEKRQKKRERNRDNVVQGYCPFCEVGSSHITTLSLSMSSKEKAGASRLRRDQYGSTGYTRS